MTKLTFEVPEDSDFWPCPEGCGGATEDPYGGPCKACWARIIEADREPARRREEIRQHNEREGFREFLRSTRDAG